MKKLFLTTCILLFLSGVLLSQSTENVIIVVIDGARYTETFGDPAHQYIPNIWNQLRPLGTIYTSFYNDGITQTNSGHASILTGTWQSILNDGSELPHKPTIFEYHRKERNSPVAENYVVLGKTKLDILAYSDHPDYGASYGAMVDTTAFQYDDVYTLENVKDVIAATHPRLMITNLSGTDRAAHDGPWSNYITKLQRADSIVNALWNFIQTDQSYQDKTTLIVTNDHGRHTTDFRSHGDGCDGCRHITMLIIGPDTPINKIDSTRQTQINIAPSLSQLLKFHTPYAAGTIIPSAFIIPGMEAYRMEQGWNLISIPRQTNTQDKALLFPTAISPAFIYNGSYVEKETLETGIGYWIKFGAAHDLYITGNDLHANTINIEEGWNLVGTLGVPVPLNNISTSSPEITLSNFFGFNGNYYTADTLLPCRGYWVKSNQSGQLFLNPNATAFPVSIKTIKDTPPPPPNINEFQTLPISYSLAQNFPNPFNPLTIINYQLPIDNWVTAKVYNILGEEVRSLVDEFQVAGYKSVEWDAAEMTSGIYIVHLTAGSYVSIVKAILIK